MDGAKLDGQSLAGLWARIVVYGLTELQSDTLRELAARLTLTGLTTDEIVNTAHELLNAGVYDDALLAIIDSTPSILSNVEPLFRRFLANASITVPEYETSIWQLLYFHIRQVAETPDDPLHALNALIVEVYYGCRCDNGKIFVESHGLERLLGDYWRRDDFLDYQAEIFENGKTGSQILNELRYSTKQNAREWLERYATHVRSLSMWP